MKITANRRDDILRRKAEWQAEFDRKKEAHDREYDSWLYAQEEVTQPVADFLKNLFTKYPLLDAKIGVAPGRYGENSLSVDIDVNHIGVFSDREHALAWGYKAFLNKGELVRETSSWSGMNAVTADQISELEQSVAVLKELSSLDWVDLLDKKLPDYRDYIKTPDPSYESRPNWDAELTAAELEDIIGERKMVLVRPFSGSWYNGEVYIAIVKDSGSQYTIIECPKYSANKGEASKYFDNADTHRVKKTNVHPVTPLDIIEV